MFEGSVPRYSKKTVPTKFIRAGGSSGPVIPESTQSQFLIPANPNLAVKKTMFAPAQGYRMYDFNGFGDVVAVNSPITFTFSIGGAVDWPSLNPFAPSTSSVITNDLAPYGTVTSVTRPFLSSNYIITVLPTYEMDSETWKSLILESMNNAGYPDAEFISMEGGTVSSQPGGTAQAISTTAESVSTGVVTPAIKGVVTVVKPAVGAVAQGASDIATTVLKPLLPYLLIGGALFAGYLYIQTKPIRSVISRKEPYQ